jgi:hypothetical protein
MAARIPGIGADALADGPQAPRRIVSRPRKKKRRHTAGEDADDEVEDAPRGREEYRWPDRRMAQPFVHVPAVPECYPFGVAARGTRPVVSVVEGRQRERREAEALLDLMAEETDEGALEREIYDEEGLDAADALVGAKAIREVMLELGLAGVALPAPAKKRRRKAAAQSESDDSAREHSQESSGEVEAERAAKRRKMFGAAALAERMPDGVHIKSAVFVEDSDLGEI